MMDVVSYIKGVGLAIFFHIGDLQIDKRKSNRECCSCHKLSEGMKFRKKKEESRRKKGPLTEILLIGRSILPFKRKNFFQLNTNRQTQIFEGEKEKKEKLTVLRF